MTTILFYNDNMSSTNELVTDSTVDGLITAALASFAANTIELWDNTTVYSASARSFRTGIVWITAAGVAAGEPAPDVNNVDWKKEGDSHWFKSYDDSYIYDLNDVVYFKHSTIGELFWKLTTSTDVVTNGSFGADSDWVKDANWAIAAGVATHTAGAADDIKQTGILTLTVRYRVTFTVSGVTAGSVTPKAGSGASGTARSSNGTFTEEIVCAGSTDLIFSATSAFDGSIDDVIALEQGISPEDDLTKWSPMLDGNYAQIYNESQAYASGTTILYLLGTAAQNGIYKANANTSAGEDPVDTPAKWDLQGSGLTSPLTTKGDIYVYGTGDARLPVGTDDQILVAKSGATLGLEWQAKDDIDDITPTTTKGDILVENGSNVIRLAVGADGEFLKALSSEASGLEWGSGAGDFSGPGSSTDNAFVRFDGTGGKTGQNAKTVESDNGDVTVTRESASTATHELVGSFLSKTSGDMANNFGGRFEFQVQDDAAGPNTIATLIWRRQNGSDTTADMILQIYDGGTPESRVVLDHIGATMFGQDRGGDRGTFEMTNTVASNGAILKLENTNSGGSATDHQGLHIRNDGPGDTIYVEDNGTDIFFVSGAKEAVGIKIDPVANTNLDIDGVTRFKSYTVATLPTVIAGGFIYVSDETGGAVVAFSDGTNWRRVQDRAIVA